DAGQLTGITYKKADNSLIGDLAYTYDANGRRTKTSGSLAKTDLPDTTSTTSYDANNRLATWGSQILNYDANGNLTSDGLKTYIWNARNQLIQIKDSTGTEVASFSYDALGRRQTKTINGVSTGFMYDGVNIVQELNGASPINNYISAGVDQVFVQQSGAGASAKKLTYLTDALGSTIRLTNTAGDKVVDYSYDPYGNTKADAVINNSFQYTGRENDGNGLYYYRARYYSPATHRFISEDPIGLNGGINTYGYVEGDPISLVDPTGQVVEGTFDRKTATVTFRDLDTNATVIVKARAGNGIYTNDSRYEGLPNRGPLPAGDYLIANAGARKDHGIWYQLLSPDGKGNYDYRNCRNVKNPETGEMECRRFFNIHNDLRSDGCVTVPSTVGEDDSNFPYSEQFEALKNLLNKTKPLVKNGKTYRGWLHVRG
ncbi:RHS repeat-associated core domain-containing protein, partial [Undibacterium sp. Ji42W]|uniref:RHS repeat-associated core domain-containing protein n=1 Tax=Undibacterium sp. Ji42W TaxID=3413039 RepID=UPI003BF33F46